MSAAMAGPLREEGQAPSEPVGVVLPSSSSPRMRWRVRTKIRP